MVSEKECYAVIFTATKGENPEGYEEMAMEMVNLAMQQQGFLNIEHAEMAGTSITISYWDSEEAIKNWKKNTRHQLAQEKGKAGWYSSYSIKVAKVTREYSFNK